MKKISLIFILSFILNLIWENLHSYLYADYMGGKITELILLRASVADAVIISLMSLPFVLIPSLKGKSWIIIFIGILFAVFIELYALNTGRWAYNGYMPLIPILGVGLTPVIQLGLLGYISYRFVVIKKII
ncbi:hypothetical protein KGQ27_03735 [Patescibacteria group bacterium]|nr:hypothetical protein [Patescibacteria group bacterium]